MIKPVSLAELRARIRALLRRAERTKTPRASRSPSAICVWTPDASRLAGEQELQLTPKEFELLAYLMRNWGVVLPRDQLLRDVWGGRVGARSQTLDVHIRWLRQKVEPNPDRADLHPDSADDRVSVRGAIADILSKHKNSVYKSGQSRPSSGARRQSRHPIGRRWRV